MDLTKPRMEETLVGAVRVRARSLAVPLAIVALALAWRVFGAGTAFLTNVVFPLHQPEQFTVAARTDLFWDTFARYDAGWYFGIARNGYIYVEGGRNSLAFFPLYPVSMGYLGYFMGGGQANYYYAGIIISWTAFAAAMVMLHRLARLDLDEAAARRAPFYAAIFPFAFFFGKVYPESLFLLLLVVTFYCFREGRWAAGALSGALVTATRVNGILVLPALALVVYQRARRAPTDLRLAVLALCAVPAGLGAYCVFVYLKTGSLFEWYESIRRWNYHPGGAPWTPLVALFSGLARPYEYLTTQHAAAYDLLNGMAAVVVLIAVPFVWRRFGAGYAALVALNLALPLSSGQFEGLGRYMAVQFPVALWLATFRSPVAQGVIVTTFAMFYMLCQALFVNLHPVF